VARAFVRANLIHKYFVFRDISTLLRAFEVCVIFATSMVAIPCKSSKTIRISTEKVVQKLPSCTLLSYEDRLLRLELNSLELRRLCFWFD